MRRILSYETFVYTAADELSTRTFPLPLACQVRYVSRHLSIFWSQTQALARLTEALLLEMPANAGFRGKKRRAKALCAQG